MKIALVIPPSREEGTPWYFPTGPGYIATALKEEGHEINILELKAEPKSNDGIIEWMSLNEPEIYCIGGLVTDYKFIKWFAETVKTLYPSIPVIVGGGIASSMQNILIKNENIDYLVIGEGDYTIKELIKTIENNGNLSLINGIIYRSRGGIVRTPFREQCDIDELPMPAYELFPMHVYLNSSIDSEVPIPEPNITMITSRGCPYQCTFCHRSISGKARLRNVGSIIEELKFLKDGYGIKGVMFNDELTITDRNRIIDLCNRMCEEKLNIKWGCAGRVNLIDEELLRRMKRAGCVWISVGMESANQRVLNMMKKGFKVEQAHKAFKLCEKVGIKISATFIFGMPGENEESVKDTVNFCKKHDLPIGSFFTATPLPGTELWNLAKEKGFITDENEEDFLSKLDNLIKFTVNFTGWSDEEFINKKEWAENEIRKVYYRKHPHAFIKDNLHSLSIAGKVLKKEGLKKTVKLAGNKLKSIMRLAK